MSKTDYNSSVILISPKKFTCPILGQVTNRILYSISKIHQPRSIGYYFLCKQLNCSPSVRKDFTTSHKLTSHNEVLTFESDRMILQHTCKYSQVLTLKCSTATCSVTALKFSTFLKVIFVFLLLILELQLFLFQSCVPQMRLKSSKSH